MELAAGFLLGLLGSFHCAVMCGPIAISLPAVNKTKLNFLLERFSYNSGRIVVYTLFGMLFGFFGERIYMAGLQQIISIAVGIAILFYLIKPLFKKNKILFTIQNGVSSFSFFKNLFAKFYSKNSKLSFFGIGILNGFLPCGFIYLALTGAAALRTPVSGALFMMLFGFGTLPVMMGISMSRNFINVNLRKKINKFSPAIALLFALIFILRGMNLGIPYLSPKLEPSKKMTEEVICH
ncbi:MAG: sulfite exporter TauE/SafE family protein [Ignavibacteria bacterium]|nr:sulfite exporter TauE/SafE family protein [Ignavibacteria bacterium]